MKDSLDNLALTDQQLLYRLVRFLRTRWTMGVFVLLVTWYAAGVRFGGGIGSYYVFVILLPLVIAAMLLSRQRPCVVPGLVAAITYDGHSQLAGQMVSQAGTGKQADSSAPPWRPEDYDRPLGERSSDEDEDFQLSMWFIRMRWIACVISGALIGLSVWVLGYLEKEVFWPLAVLVSCLVVTNIVFDLCVRRRWLVGCLKELQICSDLILLTAMLHYSGGIENPAMFAFVFHVIISGILMDRRKCYATVVGASILFGIMAFAEMGGIIQHYTLQVFPHAAEGHGLFHAAHEPVYVASLVALQAILMSLTAYFITTIMARLRAQESRAMADRQGLQRVLQATGAGFAIIDKELRPIWMNDQIKRWLNVSDDITTAHCCEYEASSEQQPCPARKTFKDGTIRVMERQIVDARGGKRFFQVTVAPLMDKDGQVHQIVELTQDITQRKLAEAEMMHSAKMAALGLMAAGVAHEVGNPLSSISVRLRLLQKNHDGAFLAESLRLLEDQTDRIARIVRAVSEFARPTKDEWTTLQINEIVEETLKILKFHKQAKRCQTVWELGKDLPETMGARDRMVQVFLNLGLNALEAMPDGGELRIKTHRSGNDICIEFADTGQGIDSEIRDRIFNPFFSTKDTGQGLGLCIVHNIVYAHGGRIDLESPQGGGSVFKVYLPIRTLGKLASDERKDVKQ